MALPGSVYLYQGEELGLEEVEDIPDTLRQDPMFQRTRPQPRPRRVPRTDPVVGRSAAVRVKPTRRDGGAVAAPAASVA